MCEKLKKLLVEFNLLDAFGELNAAGIHFRHCKKLTESDIADAIENVGRRVDFREKLFAWRTKESGKEECLQFRNANEKSLSSILKSSDKIKIILDFYAKNGKLSDNLRHELTNAILEYVFQQIINLKPDDFQGMNKEIIKIFPSEANVLDFYYIPRSIQGNAAGKLYTRYVNLKAKRKRMQEIQIEEVSDSNATSPSFRVSHEFDEGVLKAHKLDLKREDEWTVVCDKWQRSFPLRQRELGELSRHNFFYEWSKYKDPKSASLINIDFDFIYPQKGHLLKEKWTDFKEKITRFYYLNLTNKSSKLMLKNALESQNLDVQDSVLTTLLNSILQSPARSFDKEGNKRQKFSILESQDFFILTFASTNELDGKLAEISHKFKITNVTSQQSFLKLENATLSMNQPCVMDIKIGKRTWDPLSTPKKRFIEEGKYFLCKRYMGLCIPGFQVYSLNSTKLFRFGKDLGKSMRPDQITEILELFLNVSSGVHSPLLFTILTKLYKIRHWFSYQTSFKFYASSILIAYDVKEFAFKEKPSSKRNDMSICWSQCNMNELLRKSLAPLQILYPETANWVQVKMIDFAHVYPVENNDLDTNYLFGLQNLISCFERIIF